ncbi:hypothetical protein IFR04_014065 [Cadophora malorum]|uniref:Zn(2)-C6 fungal-type domain-containing protein n=1 Tax=Cadophora malorum TaxID=108018 RepID=A0A8H7T5I5_9HELO|nr:hypothetical protein IFR04_014065 [Cadophora malorum]
MMTQRPGPGPAPNEYRGIKRSQQACLNCRRKKAKCSGQRPVCGFCRRLNQVCEWTRVTVDSANSASSNENTNRDMNNSDDLSRRVASIETKLDNLQEMLSSYLPALLNQARDNGNSSTHSTSPHQNDLNGRESFDLLSMTSATAVPPHNATASSFRILPPQPVVDSLINLYFERAHNQPYSFFHEESFRRHLELKSLPEFLLFAVLASAVRFSSDPYFGDFKSEALRGYASESWKLIVAVCFGPESDPNIFYCQAVTLLSIIDFTAGRRHPGWLKIGLSIRIAQDLQLMMEPSQDLSHAEQEERRRVFWSIYVLDKLCSCGRARPVALADAHCFVQLPCDETTFRTGEWKKTLSLEQAFSTNETGTEEISNFALVVLAASALGRTAQHSIHQNLRGESRLPPWDSKSLFATINSVLLQLEMKYEFGNSLQDSFARLRGEDGTVDMQVAGPVIFSRALFRTCQCLLHHPLLLHQQSRVLGIKPPLSFWNRAIQTCRENACSLSELLRDVQAAGYIATYSFMGYCATISASIHTLYLEDADTSIQQKSAQFYQTDILFLKTLSQRWKNAEWMVFTVHPPLVDLAD